MALSPPITAIPKPFQPQMHRSAQQIPDQSMAPGAPELHRARPSHQTPKSRRHTPKTTKHHWCKSSDPTKMPQILDPIPAKNHDQHHPSHRTPKKPRHTPKQPSTNGDNHRPLPKCHKFQTPSSQKSLPAPPITPPRNTVELEHTTSTTGANHQPSKPPTLPK